MTRPRTPRGAREKGNLGEATIKLLLERKRHTVLNGQMAESAVDLILLCCQTLVEVKTRKWSKEPSPRRRLCAVAGDRWRKAGYSHLVICDALSAEPTVHEAGMVNGQASILHKHPDYLHHACGRGTRTGVSAPPVPPDPTTLD